MNRYILFLALACIPFMQSCKDGMKKLGFNKEASEVKLYENKEGNFKIAFPDTPSVSKEIVPTAAGDIGMNMCMLEEGKDKVYMVAYSDYPAGIITKENAPTILEGSKNGALQSFGKCTVEEEKTIDKDGHPGVYFKAKSDQNYHVIYHLYIVGDRLYQVGMLQDKAYPPKDVVDHFFNSFEFIVKK